MFSTLLAFEKFKKFPTSVLIFFLLSLQPNFLFGMYGGGSSYGLDEARRNIERIEVVERGLKARGVNVGQLSADQVAIERERSAARQVQYRLDDTKYKEDQNTRRVQIDADSRVRMQADAARAAEAGLRQEQ